MMPSWKDWKRFFAKVHIPEDPKGCWEWTAARLKSGYGCFGVRGVGMRVAHRRTYEWFKGPIPEGLEMDHLCRNRACVNPDHLEAVTRRVNLLRGINVNRDKTHCPRGHEFTPENTRICKTYGRVKGRFRRVCRKCHNESNKRRIEHLRAEGKWKDTYSRWYASRKAKALIQKDL